MALVTLVFYVAAANINIFAVCLDSAQSALEKICARFGFLAQRTLNDLRHYFRHVVFHGA